VSALRLAIDLGTSHTVAVVRREAEPRTLLFDGSPVLPSAIFSEPPRLHVGRDAERMALIDPSRFEPHPKRRVDEGSVLLGNTEVTVVDMFVALLRRVVAEANQTGVHVGDGAVLTCPADWGASRRKVLMQAAQLAGLGPVQLVDEPVAAATYCMEVMSQQVPIGGAVLVFDFGGGTLDSSVLRREPGGLRVLSVGGLDDLGGVDIDAALVGHLGQLIQLQSPRVWQRLANPGPQSEQRERRQFWDDVRAAKEMLSRTTSAPVHVPGTDSALHLTREELDRVAGPLIDRAVDETRRVLRASGLEPSSLSGLFLVGGSSRIPLVASRLHARFGLPPVVPEQPELPVAYGGFVAAGGRTTGQATGRAAAGQMAPPRQGPQQGPQQGSQQGPQTSQQLGPRGPMTTTGPMGGPANAPQSGPPGMPMSAPPTHNTQQVAGFASGPVGSYAPSSGGPTPPNAPVSEPSYPPFHGSGPMQPVPQQQMARPQPGPPGPVPGPMSPTMGPHRPPRRPGRLRYVIVGVVVTVLLLCGGGGFWVYSTVRDKIDDVTDGSTADDGRFGQAGDLKQVGAATLPGTGALTALVANGVTYYAAVKDSSLVVAALNADGTEKWTKSYQVEPTDVRITATGSVLYIDCEKAATHGGKNVRLVVDAANGAEKILRSYERERVTHFVGNDAFVEVNPLSKDGRMQRVDLTTGQPKWDVVVYPGRPSSLDLLAIPNVAYAADGPSTQQGQIGPSAGILSRAPTGPDWRQSIAADQNTFVGLDSTKGTATVYNAADGKARGSGAVPFDGETFYAYQNVLVGRLDDKVSPGRTVVAAYGLDNFAKRWEVPLPAGARVEQIRPCGPQQMCVLYNANSNYTVFAMDLQTGKEAWKNSTGSSRYDWYLLKDGLVMGDWEFGNLGKPALYDPATGTRKYALDGGITGVTALAGADKWVLVRTYRYLGSRGSVNTLAAVDITTGKLTTGVDFGDSGKQIKNASMDKNTAAAVSESRQLVIAQTG
jgi:molecular chaperone HscA